MNENMQTGEAAALPPGTVRIGGRVIKLQPPDSFTLCNEIVIAGGTNIHRAAAAALGMCWQERGRAKGGGLQRPAVTYEACGYSPMIFGERFADALVAAGVPWPEVFAAGLQAYHLLASKVLPSDAVDEALENFEDPPQPAGE